MIRILFIMMRVNMPNGRDKLIKIAYNLSQRKKLIKDTQIAILLTDLA